MSLDRYILFWILTFYQLTQFLRIFEGNKKGVGGGGNVSRPIKKVPFSLSTRFYPCVRSSTTPLVSAFIIK